jgi:hypothetical protein
LPDISSDKSTFELRAGSERLSAMEDAVARAVGQASPISTLKGDDSHWRFWCVHAANFDTAAVRGDLAANCGLDVIGHQREVFIMASFVIARYTNMRARRAGGRPKPQSAVNSLSAVIRCHRRRGITLARAPWLACCSAACSVNLLQSMVLTRLSQSEKSRSVPPI